MHKYKIEFYQDNKGYSQIYDFLNDLKDKAKSNKDARIQHKQIVTYIQLLEDNGTKLGSNITKHLRDDIWELRPGRNRVLYFFCKGDTYVLLHQFLKKTQKTPKKEIEKAIKEMNDYINREVKKWKLGMITKNM